jgi:hypothetical protein
MASQDVLREVRGLQDLIAELAETHTHLPAVQSTYGKLRSQLDHIAAVASSLSNSSSEEVHQLAIMSLVLAQSFGRLLTLRADSPPPPEARDAQVLN